MCAALGVPETMAKSLGAFIETEGLSLDVVASEGGTVRVEQAGKGRASTPSVLQAGGSITCALARDMATTLGIKTSEVGKLLNHLDVKIRACDLGCFE